jgi:fluoride ion exporter CrcB/FEX
MFARFPAMTLLGNAVGSGLLFGLSLYRGKSPHVPLPPRQNIRDDVIDAVNLGFCGKYSLLF